MSARRGSLFTTAVSSLKGKSGSDSRSKGESPRPKDSARSKQGNSPDNALGKRRLSGINERLAPPSGRPGARLPPEPEAKDGEVIYRTVKIFPSISGAEEVVTSVTKLLEVPVKEVIPPPGSKQRRSASERSESSRGLHAQPREDTLSPAEDQPQLTR